MDSRTTAGISTLLRHRRSEAAFGLLAVGLLAWLLVRGWTAGSGEHSDFSFFYHAAHAARSGGDIYDVPGKGYWYPPLFAVLLIPLTWFSLTTAAYLWTCILTITLACSAWLLARELTDRLAPGADRLTIAAVAGASLLVLAEPWKTSFQFGNCDTLIVLSSAAGLRLLNRRPALGGFCVAAGAGIKYFPLALLPYLLVRRRWMAAAGLTFGLATLALAPALVLGWDRNLEFLARSWSGVGRLLGLRVRDDAAPLLSITADYNYSVPGCAARWFEGRADSGTLSAVVSAGIALLTAAIVFTAYRAGRTPLLVRDATQDDGTPAGRTIVGMEWAAVFALGVIFAPQATYRQFTLLLPIVTGACVLARFGKGPTRWLAAGAIGLMVAGVTSPPRWLIGGEFFRRWNEGGGAALCVLVFVGLCLAGALREASSRRSRAPT